MMKKRCIGAMLLAVTLLLVSGCGQPAEPADGTPDTTTTTTTTTVAATAGFYVTTDALNVRSGPGTQYEVLTVLPVGKVVEVLGTEGAWHRISFAGGTGYVHGDYVTPSTTGASTTTAATTTTTTTKKPTTTTTPIKDDTCWLDDKGLLQFKTDGRYVQPEGVSAWNLMLVNDWNGMPAGYESTVSFVPVGHQKVDSRILADLQAMLTAGKAHGIGVQSGYRSADHQGTLYWRQVQRYRNAGRNELAAQKAAGTVVKRPGFSEHNTGLAVDLGGSGNFKLEQDFENTAAFEWLMAHCADYGFILRFPKDKESITGVIYEPWHYRYVGKEAAKAIMDGKLCLEEYLQQTNQ